MQITEVEPVQLHPTGGLQAGRGRQGTKPDEQQKQAVTQCQRDTLGRRERRHMRDDRENTTEGN